MVWSRQLVTLIKEKNGLLSFRLNPKVTIGATLESRRGTEWQIQVFVVDSDVAAAFDRVSPHVIVDAVEAVKVPPMLVSAWLREYRGQTLSSSWMTS